VLRRLAATLLVFLLQGSALAAEPRAVLYFNESGPRVDVALGKLRAAVAGSAWSRRHAVAIEHVVVSHADPALAQRIREEVEARRPAAIIAPSALATFAARLATQDVPILFASQQDPVALKLVRSLESPGGNLAGFTNYLPVEEKRLELLRELVPRLRRVGVVVDTWWYQDPASRDFDRVARERLGLEVAYFEAADTAALVAQIARRGTAGIDAWYVSGSPAFFDPAGVAAAIGATRKPAVYVQGMMAERGGLMSYEARIADPFAEWARLLGMILDGASPGTIPVAVPHIFELKINLATAKAAGIPIPVSLLRRAELVGAP
jgi:putative ABC transport system substrate-binding protein